MTNHRNLIKELDAATKILEAARQVVHDLEAQCKHPKKYVTVKRHSNYGHKDPLEKLVHWTDHRCTICGEWWQEPNE